MVLTVLVAEFSSRIKAIKGDAEHLVSRIKLVEGRVDAPPAP